MNMSRRGTAWHVFLAASLPILLLILNPPPCEAGSAKWRTNPASGDWNSLANWQPATIPNGPGDTARFAGSATTNISISVDTEVNGVQFLAGAAAFTITAPIPRILTLSGAGITNTSGVMQNFVTAGDSIASDGIVNFTNSARAGSLTTFTNNSGALFGSPRGTQFFDTASADHGRFINNGGTLSGGGRATTNFFDNSTAANGTFINNGSAASGSFGGATYFFGTSTAANGTFTNDGRLAAVGGTGATTFRENSSAGNATLTNNGVAIDAADGGFTTFLATADASNATITNNGGIGIGSGGGTTNFLETSAAGNATIIVNGGITGGEAGDMFFYDDSTGGTARIVTAGNGILDISPHNLPGVTTGSIEGSGLARLGANNLTVGANGRSTTFSGVIQDGGQNGGTGASLTKLGSGTLTLSAANTYTGATVVNAGVLLIKKASGSGTGSGAVQVNTGTLGGNGTIAGAVTVGTTPDMGAILSPGLNGIGTLTIQGPLKFIGGATLQFEVNSANGKADKVTAMGYSIVGFGTFAIFSFVDLGNGTLAPGTVITVINNTGANHLTGQFSNLAEGATFTAGNNTYQAHYQGGDGNDLTLTVVP